MRKYLFGIVGLALLTALIFPPVRSAIASAMDSCVSKRGLALPESGLLVAGSDGTLLRPIKTDTGGNLILIGNNGLQINQDGLTGNLIVTSNSTFAGTSADVGNGTTGTGTQRVTIASDSNGQVTALGLGFNGAPTIPRYCDRSITFTTLSTTARVQQIAAVAGQNIYICGWQLFGSTATTGIDLTWTEGTGSNCATGTATIGGKFLTTPTAVTTTPNSVWGPTGVAHRMTITTSDALCITQSATTNSTLLAGTIFYTQN